MPPHGAAFCSSAYENLLRDLMYNYELSGISLLHKDVLRTVAWKRTVCFSLETNLQSVHWSDWTYAAKGITRNICWGLTDLNFLSLFIYLNFSPLQAVNIHNLISFSKSHHLNSFSPFSQPPHWQMTIDNMSDWQFSAVTERTWLNVLLLHKKQQ